MRFSLKPVFIGWITLLPQLPLQLFLTLWCGGFFGSFLGFTKIFPKDSPLPYIWCGAIAFIAFPSVIYIGKRLNYARTEYKFFDDRLEFEEGFFTINKKVIRYKDVKECTLRKGMLQQSCGLGSIYLATMATGSSYYDNALRALGFGNVSASGVFVQDIRHPDEAYENIRKLVET